MSYDKDPDPLMSADELLAQLNSILKSTEEELIHLKAETIRGLVKWRSKLPNLSGISLSKADLCALDLTYVDFTESNLSQALMIGANLTQADLVRTNFHKTNLGGANLYNADMTEAHFLEANLAKTDWSEAILHRANLEKADIGHGSDFRDADLTSANLTNANLRTAKFPGTNFTGVILKGADLTLSENLTIDQVRSAIIDKTTRFPSYIKMTWKSETEYDIRIEHDDPPKENPSQTSIEPPDPFAT